ncbi:hypothetical protein KDA_42370 [Dictyobacter alpinus]|uniref:Exonuclease domain-containing protein n=1 Tax=Dictyobacter alpinus TaxID=2014873 RepID=A0A402BBI4_9CHLR|nr:hypothetical protein [Dictyobacter alpinus]GCE28753.1 hypothetical protein KDA_42370 [Dictyobacter alpinus]
MMTQYIMPTRQAYSRWCRTLQWHNDWVVLATEDIVITGQRAEAIAVAVVDHQGEVIFERMFRPYSSNQGRLLDDDIDDLLTFAQIWSDLNDVLLNKTIISYGALYNSQLLTRTAALRDMTMPEHIWHCAMVAYTEYQAEFSPQGSPCQWPSLIQVCQRHHIPRPSGQGTRARADACATWQLLRIGARSPDIRFPKPM